MYRFSLLTCTARHTAKSCGAELCSWLQYSLAVLRIRLAPYFANVLLSPHIHSSSQSITNNLMGGERRSEHGYENHIKRTR